MPAVNASDYFNRKKFPSIVLPPAMVDHEHCFMNVYAEWPGCVYDAQIKQILLVSAMGEAGNILPNSKNTYLRIYQPHYVYIRTPTLNTGTLKYPSSSSTSSSSSSSFSSSSSCT